MSTLLPQSPVAFGVDVYSLRSQLWTPFEYIDYCRKSGASEVHFSELRFLGGLEPEHLRQVRDHADRLGVRIGVGMRSICPTSRLFDPAQGSAEEQLSRVIDIAKIVGSPIVRAVLGSVLDRTGSLPLEAHIANTVKVLRTLRSKCLDTGIKVAIENHSGDMQADELKTLIEEAGTDYVGACIDSGNPLITLEDPHLTLEILAPYVLVSHVRDTAVWRTPEGAAVCWVRMGEGNVGIDDYVRKYMELCPGRAISLEIIVWDQPRAFPYYEPSFWNAYRNVKTWQFARFLKLLDSGTPRSNRPPVADPLAREREDFDVSMQYLINLVGGGQHERPRG